MPPRNDKMSPLNRIRQLEEEKNTLLQEAKAEAMERVNQALVDLNALGFNYRVSEGGGRGAAAGSRKGTRQIRNAPCPICGFLTNPPHDRRAHRTQEPKRPFTAEELKTRGYAKA